MAKSSFTLNTICSYIYIYKLHYSVEQNITCFNSGKANRIVYKYSYALAPIHTLTRSAPEKSPFAVGSCVHADLPANPAAGGPAAANPASASAWLIIIGVAG